MMDSRQSMAIATPWRTATGTSRSHHNVAPSTLHLAPSRLAQPAGLGSICEPRSREHLGASGSICEHLRASANICEPLRASGNICEPRSREFCALFGARKRARSLVSCMSQATRGVTDVMMCVDRCVSVSGRLMVDWACGLYTAPVFLTCLSVLHNHACIGLNGCLLVRVLCRWRVRRGVVRNGEHRFDSARLGARKYR